MASRAPIWCAGGAGRGYEGAVLLFLLLVAATLASCSSWNGAGVTRVAGSFTVVGGNRDAQAVEDLATALASHAPRICKDLSHECGFPVLVTVFPNQATLDRLGMNPSMRGYRAYSGSRRIEMVTPRESLSLGGVDLAYSQRVLIAVHEFVHLVIDEIDPSTPSWLDEGAACFIGPHDVYSHVCSRRFPFEQVPSFADLQRSYQSVQGADLFAYAVLDYVAAHGGRRSVSRLLRSPDSLFAMLGVHDHAEFEKGWREYMRGHYVGARAAQQGVESDEAR